MLIKSLKEAVLKSNGGNQHFLITGNQKKYLILCSFKIAIRLNSTYRLSDESDEANENQRNTEIRKLW